MIWTGLIAAAWIDLTTWKAVSDLAVVATEAGDVLFGLDTAATTLPSAPSTKPIPRSAPMTTRCLGSRMGTSRPQCGQFALSPGSHSLSPLRGITAIRASFDCGRLGLPQCGQATASVLSGLLQSGHWVKAMCLLSVDARALAILQIQAERELVRVVGHVSIQVRGVRPHSNLLPLVVEFEKPQIATSARIVSRTLVEPLVV